MSTIKVDNLQTTSGAGLYPARAWVNFDGTGTVAIRASGNVSSITDVATGVYKVNFTAALSSASYADTFGDTSGTNGHIAPFIPSGLLATYKTASYFQSLTYTTAGALQDSNNVSLVMTL